LIFGAAVIAAIKINVDANATSNKA